MEWTLTRRRIELGEVSLAVRDYRPERADAPVVVLLHGVMCRGASWDRLARALCAAGQRVLAPDQRGHGRSSRPPALAENYRRAAYVGDLERLLDAAEIERCALIGHSTGGLNALVYAARHPDRVSALLVEDQAIEPRPSSHAEGWRTWLAGWPVPFSSLGAVREFFGATRPSYADHFIELFEEAEDGWRPLFDPEAVVQTIAGNDAQPWWDELAAVECPALVVKGGESELSLDEAERMARTLPRGSLLVVEPAGHVVHDDCPETFLEATLRLLGAADDAAIPRLVRRQYESGDARFEIDADRAALLLIDMQEEFVSPGGPFFVPEAAARVPAAARLLDACRERGLPVVHTAFSDTHRLLDRPRRGAVMPNRFAGLDVGDRFRGAPRFASGLEPAAGEVVLLKPSYGAFADTPLETILKNLGRDTVILAGTLTNYCVGATARQAYERGLAVVVASDACATDDAAGHDAELRVLRRGFARVLGTERILRELDRSTRAAAGAPAGAG
jgi:pimeloyl-ACP methyl ester carboxylesterase/nicotinamidase-related amidase